MAQQTTDIYGCVDGTGPDSDTQYAADFANSHVRTRWRTWHTNKSWYIRGPFTSGEDTHVRAAAIARVVKQAYSGQNNSGRIFLSGYSRGGAAVAQAANLLADDGIPVYAMLLFDAVDRARNITRTRIPATVTHAFHAMRDPTAESREFFGNCSHNDHAAGVNYKFKHFYCTHGGVGGTPWARPAGASATDTIDEGSTSITAGAGALFGIVGGAAVDSYMDTEVTYAQDQAGSAQSGAWMAQQLAAVI